MTMTGAQGRPARGSKYLPTVADTKLVTHSHDDQDNYGDDHDVADTKLVTHSDQAAGQP